jgi:hypothetical protein
MNCIHNYARELFSNKYILAIYLLPMVCIHLSANNYESSWKRQATSLDKLIFLDRKSMENSHVCCSFCSDTSQECSYAYQSIQYSCKIQKFLGSLMQEALPKVLSIPSNDITAWSGTIVLCSGAKL